MSKSQENTEYMLCNVCFEPFMYNDVKWLPEKTKYFSNKNFKHVLKGLEDKSFVESFKKKRKEMLDLQKRFHNGDYDSIVDDFINMHKVGIEIEEIKMYKIHMLNVVKRLRNNLDDDMKRHVDNLTQYPGLVFGCYDFSYTSRCPHCTFPTVLVWRGHESLKRCIKIKSKDDDDKSTFRCISCSTELIAEHHIWKRVDTPKGIYLETICQKCNKAQPYPYGFNSLSNVVESGGPHSRIEYEKIPKWMITVPRSYICVDIGVLDSQIYTVPDNREIADAASILFTFWKN